MTVQDKFRFSLKSQQSTSRTYTIPLKHTFKNFILYNHKIWITGILKFCLCMSPVFIRSNYHWFVIASLHISLTVLPSLMKGCIKEYKEWKMITRGTRLTDNKSGRLKNQCSNQFSKHRLANIDHMPRLECCYLVTSVPFQPASEHTHPQIHTFQPPPNRGLHEDPGRLTPPRPPKPSPAYPFPLFSLPSHWPPLRRTIVYFHSPPRPCWSKGGAAKSLHYCLVFSCTPSLPTRPDPIHSTQRHHLYHPTVRERERDGARRGKKTRRGERRWRLRRERRKGREREREQEASAWVLRCLSESICQIVFTVWRLPCCFSFFKHCPYWFFFTAFFIVSFNFYFLQPSNPLCFFPTLRISSLKVFSDNPISLFPWPASLLSSLLSSPTPPPSSSEYILHLAVV